MRTRGASECFAQARISSSTRRCTLLTFRKNKHAYSFSIASCSLLQKRALICLTHHQTGLPSSTCADIEICCPNFACLTLVARDTSLAQVCGGNIGTLQRVASVITDSMPNAWKAGTFLDSLGDVNEGCMAATVPALYLALTPAPFVQLPPTSLATLSRTWRPHLETPWLLSMRQWR